VDGAICDKRYVAFPEGTDHAAVVSAIEGDLIDCAGGASCCEGLASDCSLVGG
jgi:hypothetical protein